MSQQGRLIVKKTPKYAIREDAAIILEEFLKKHIAENENDFRHSTVTGRNKSDPLSERTKVHVERKKNGVPRSKTMPSKNENDKNSQERNPENYVNNNGMPRSKTLPSENDSSKVNDLKLIDSDSSAKVHNGMDKGFESSADSEDDPQEVLASRKKKSAYQKAKQRLRHLLHLHPKEKTDVLMTGSEQNFPALTSTVKKKHSLDERSSHRADSKHSTLEFQGQGSLINGRKSSFFGSFRKPQKSKAARGRENKPETTKDYLDKPGSHQVSFLFTGGAVAQGTPDLPSITTSSLPPPPPPAATSTPQQQDLLNLTADYSNLPPAPPQPSGRGSSVSKSSSPSPLNIGFIPAGPSSSSSNLPASDYTNDGSNTNILSSIQSNALDSPGDDIDYIDLDDSASQTSSRKIEIQNENTTKIVSKFKGTSELENLRSVAKDYDREIEKQRSMVDGITSSKLSSPSVKDMVDELSHDALDGQASANAQHHLNKDELYGKIAKRLAEMADSYSVTMSNSESRVTASVLAAPPSELERDIIDCLRSIGDRNSAAVDENFEAVKAEATEEAYHRFKSTIQNSMGNELSWNHLAFVFFTTKGVISALGKGTKAASKAKEFTLDYISDNFASWIMDQGGFDSIVLSSSDSDFDLD